MTHTSTATSTDHAAASHRRDVLDCLIVGYNDLDIRAVEQAHRATRRYSGAYRNFTTNTIWFQGRRRALMDVMNAAMSASGPNPNLHVAKLPNLGVCYLKNYLQRRGLQVEIVNFFNAERDRCASLLDTRPMVVAITTTFYVEPAPIIDLVTFIRAHAPDTKIVVGGPYVFNLCSQSNQVAEDFVLQRIGADFYIVDSQGEQTLVDLLTALRSGASEVERVPNLIYLDEKRLHRTARVPENNSLDENVIDWDHFPDRIYVPTVQMRTARSCSFKCAFCRYPVVAGALTLTSLARVEAELTQLCAAGVKTIVFVDDTFNVPLPRFKDLCRMMIRNQFGFTWFSYLRCSNADAETFDLMCASGCAGVFLGIESADKSVLTNMNKAATSERYRYGIEQLKSRGILTFVSLIIGFPGESAETVRNTIAFVEETSPTFYRAELYYHDVKTPIHERAAVFGLEGAGYSWKHRTMSWRDACDQIDGMYASIRNSTILPLYMFDFWSIPYVLGRGLPLDTFSAFAKSAQSLLVAGLQHDGPAGAADEARVLDVFRAPTVRTSPLHA